MATYLLTVEDVSDFAGRRLIIVPGPIEDSYVGPHEVAVRLVLPSGVAAAIGSHGVASFGADNLPKQAAVVIAYTAHSDTSSDDPPTLVAVGAQDGIAPSFAIERRIAALYRAGTAVEYHQVPRCRAWLQPRYRDDAEGCAREAAGFGQEP